MKIIDNTPIKDFNEDWGDPDGTGMKEKSKEQVQKFIKGSIKRIEEDAADLKKDNESFKKNVDNQIANQSNEIAVFKKDVTNQIENYKPIEINGNVTNAADEEDLTAENGMIKIANRGTLYGKGYKILRRGVDLQSQFNQENTIYEIRYDFDLGGVTLNIPAGCTLKFEGGKLHNGNLNGDYTSFIAGEDWCFSDITFTGTWRNKSVSPCHFGAKSNTFNSLTKEYEGINDSTSAFQQALNCGFSVDVPAGAYYIANTIDIDLPITITCTGKSYGGVDGQFKKNKSRENTVLYSDMSGILFNVKAVINWVGGIIDLRQSTVNEVIAFNFDASFGNWGTEIDTTIFGSSSYNLVGYKFNCDDDNITASGYITYMTIKGFVYKAKYGFCTPLSSPKQSQRFRWITGISLLFDSRGCQYVHKLHSGQGYNIGGRHQAEHILSEEERFNIAPTYIQGASDLCFYKR